MTSGVAHIVMAVATRCLRHDRGEWGQAMWAEFGEAVEDRNSLAFALGCLMMAWRQMPSHDEGRFILSNHALALGLIVPIATFHLGCALSGFRVMVLDHDQYHALLAAGGAHDRVLADAYHAATPMLTVLLLLLALAHLLIAWVVLDRQWRRAAIIWLFAAAIAAALVGIIATTLPSASGIAIQLMALAIELITIPLLAAWQTKRASVHSI